MELGWDGLSWGCRVVIAGFDALSSGFGAGGEGGC